MAARASATRRYVVSESTVGLMDYARQSGDTNFILTSANFLAVM